MLNDNWEGGKYGLLNQKDIVEAWVSIGAPLLGAAEPLGSSLGGLK